MPRIDFPKNLQCKFLEDVRNNLDIDWLLLSNKLGVSKRTLFDWRREKFKLSKSALEVCLNLTGGKVKAPQYVELPDFWSIPEAARKGGLTTALRYGGPGTIEGRRKGGRISQERRRLYPEQYPGCVLPKIIVEPKKNVELAEFFGIMLGDGSISKDADIITI